MSWEDHRRGEIHHHLDRLRAGGWDFYQILGENNMIDINTAIIILFIIGCVVAYKAFTTQDPKQKKLFGLIALVIGGILFALRNYIPK